MESSANDSLDASPRWLGPLRGQLIANHDPFKVETHRPLDGRDRKPLHGGDPLGRRDDKDKLGELSETPLQADFDGDFLDDVAACDFQRFPSANTHPRISGKHVDIPIQLDRGEGAWKSA